jgi:hypothetical protein
VVTWRILIGRVVPGRTPDWLDLSVHAWPGTLLGQAVNGGSVGLLCSGLQKIDLCMAPLRKMPKARNRSSHARRARHGCASQLSSFILKLTSELLCCRVGVVFTGV